MFSTVEDFFVASRPSIQLFDEWVGKVTPSAVADHICYKCESSEEFEVLRELFESASAFIYQSIISERRIAIIKFPQPIPSALGDIWFLELSDQKPDGSQKSGFDHIEIYPEIGTMADFVAALEAHGVRGEKIIRPHHTTFDIHLSDTFKVRIEPEQLMEKIMRDEIAK